MSGGSGSRKPTAVSSLLPGVLSDLGVLEQVQRASAVEIWPEVAGEHVARVTRPRAIDGATLIVEVRSSAWLAELSMMKGDFLERLNEHMQDTPLKGIVFVLAETA